MGSFGSLPHEQILALLRERIHDGRFLHLVKKLTTYPAMKRLIKGWLEAGVLEEGKFIPSEEGTRASRGHLPAPGKHRPAWNGTRSLASIHAQRGETRPGAVC